MVKPLKNFSMDKEFFEALEKDLNHLIEHHAELMTCYLVMDKTWVREGDEWKLTPIKVPISLADGMTLVYRVEVKDKAGNYLFDFFYNGENYYENYAVIWVRGYGVVGSVDDYKPHWVAESLVGQYRDYVTRTA